VKNQATWQHVLYAQGRNEVRWTPGKEASLSPPCSNLRSFASKFTVLQKVLVTLLKLVYTPAVIWRPGNCAPLASLRYAPVYVRCFLAQYWTAWRLYNDHKIKVTLRNWAYGHTAYYCKVQWTACLWSTKQLFSKLVLQIEVEVTFINLLVSSAFAYPSFLGNTFFCYMLTWASAQKMELELIITLERPFVL